MTKFYRKWPLWMVVLFAGVLAGVAGAQTPPPSTPQEPQAQSAASAEGKKITPQEADELFRSMDKILQFASQDSGYPIHHEVKRRLIDRDTMESYVEKETTQGDDAKRLARAELVLKKFGLLPPDFDLPKFLVALLKEQVAAYYDAKTQTVNLLDWVQPDQQKSVLAHELTHALQDQSFGLKKWMRPWDTDIDREKEITAKDIADDETSVVRQAVVEGQAMAVLVDYMLQPSGRSLLTSPEVVSALKDGMLVGTADSVEFQNAPIYMKEALTFPYRYGLDFTATLLAHGGKDEAFAGAFRNPPHSTRQIMQPQTYLSGEVVPPIPMPDFKQDFKNYQRFDVGAVGEFDVAILVDQYAGVDESRQMYPHWRGGYYYAVRPKGDPAAPLGLLYVSRWSDPESAAHFAAIYAQSLPKRYRHLRPVGEDGIADVAKLTSLTSTHTWLTEDGDVEIDLKGDDLVVTESLDPETIQKVEDDAFGAAVGAPR